MSALTAYYLDQLGIASWTIRPGPTISVLIVLDEMNGDLQSWLLGIEGRLLKKILSCIDLAWDQVAIICQQDQNSLAEQLVRTRPKIILRLGQRLQGKDVLQAKYSSIPVVDTLAPRELINNPISKRTAYVEMQLLRHLLDSMT